MVRVWLLSSWVPPKNSCSLCRQAIFCCVVGQSPIHVNYGNVYIEVSGSTPHFICFCCCCFCCLYYTFFHKWLLSEHLCKSDTWRLFIIPPEKPQRKPYVLNMPQARLLFTITFPVFLWLPHTQQWVRDFSRTPCYLRCKIANASLCYRSILQEY